MLATKLAKSGTKLDLWIKFSSEDNEKRGRAILHEQFKSYFRNETEFGITNKIRHALEAEGIAFEILPKH